MSHEPPLELPNAIVNAALNEPVVCEEHCMHTWQCSACGALIHGVTGRDAHEKWHRQYAWLGPRA